MNLMNVFLISMISMISSYLFWVWATIKRKEDKIFTLAFKIFPNFLGGLGLLYAFYLFNSTDRSYLSPFFLFSSIIWFLIADYSILEKRYFNNTSRQPIIRIGLGSLILYIITYIIFNTN